jgi:SAM-dependent methyltransferase
MTTVTYAFDETDPQAPPCTELIRQADPSAAGVSLRVAADDDMFAFLLATQHERRRAATMYFRGGLSIAQVVYSVAAWRFGSVDAVGSVLDFAAGYGRSTRFLASRLPSSQLWVSEIQADALTFQHDAFGVPTLLSTADPADLAVERTFGLVYASSLFSHLPRSTFVPWLAKLWEFVAPGGVLAVSVRDEALNPGNVQLEDGFAFTAVSEISALPGEQYGVAFTTQDFIRRAIAEAAGADAAAGAVRLPRAMNQSQDVWVICRGDAPAQPLQHEAGPMGAVDVATHSGAGLELNGWAADLGFCGAGESHRISGVTIHADGAPVADAVYGHERPDLPPAYGRPDDRLLLDAGWRASLPRPAADSVLTVVATCEHGARGVLEAARVADLTE